MTRSISPTLRPQSEIVWRDRSEPAVPVTEVAFIDPNVDDIDVLLAGLRPEVEAVLLNAVEPAPRQMAQALAGRRDLEAIHVSPMAGRVRCGSLAELCPRRTWAITQRTSLGSGAV